MAATKPAFGPGIRERFAAAPGITPAAHEEANDVRATIKARMDALLAEGRQVLGVDNAMLEGCPLGISLIGAAGSDLALLDLAGCV